MNSYKKLYIAGFTALSIAIAIFVWFAYLIFGGKSSISSEKTITPISNVEEFPDTVFKEKVVERVIHDTVIQYIKPKPIVEKKDTTKVAPLSTSNQSQI